MAAPDISIRLEVLPGESVAEQVANAAKYKFDAIALPGRFKDRWLRPLRECRGDLPLPMASISLGFVHSLLSPSEARRQECRDSLLELLDLCAELGAPRLNVPPCLIQDNPERITESGSFGTLRERLDAMLLEELPAIGNAAAEREVVFLIEPVNKYESEYLNSVVHAAELVDELDQPAVKVTADFFHMQLEELDTAAALERSGAVVQHVHVAENTRVEPGPGSMDYRPGFRELQRVGYAGLLEVECRYLSGPADAVLPASANYLRSVWNQSAMQ